MWKFSTLWFVRERPWGCGSINSNATIEPISDEELLERHQRATKLKQELFVAIVVSWDESRVTILCPFCRKTHTHGISHFAFDSQTGDRIQDDHGRYTYERPSPTRCHARVAHCDHENELRNIVVSYTIIFPFEEDLRVTGLSFEINKDRKEFRTVGLSINSAIGPRELESCYPSEASEESELGDAFQEMSLRAGDYEVVMKFEKKDGEDQITEHASDLIQQYATRGEIDFLKHYLDRSPDPGSLLRVTGNGGTSLLGFAVPNGHFEVVKYLLERGCDVNAADSKGRTPLMEAALWGTPQILNVLLQAGADKLRRDRYGMTAHDLAEESDRNDLERHKRSFKYEEDPYIKKKHRAFIRALLGPDPAPRNSTAMLCRDINPEDAHFYKSQSVGTISLVLPAQGISINTQSKTAVVLLRRDVFPPLVAVSGWAGLHTQEFLSPEAGLQRLNQGYWAFEALKVASDIGVNFEEHRHDQAGFPGIYNACHAEVQLMSLFVRRNYVFREYEEGESEIKDDFLQLFMLQPRECTADILVSNQPCASCLWFRDCILERLGIKFSLHVLQVKT